jgi:hypothetical protein
MLIKLLKLFVPKESVKCPYVRSCYLKRGQKTCTELEVREYKSGPKINAEIV